MEAHVCQKVVTHMLMLCMTHLQKKKLDFNLDLTYIKKPSYTSTVVPL